MQRVRFVHLGLLMLTHMCAAVQGHLLRFIRGRGAGIGRGSVVCTGIRGLSVRSRDVEFGLDSSVLGAKTLDCCELCARTEVRMNCVMSMVVQR